jgi:hypothetical protein
MGALISVFRRLDFHCNINIHSIKSIVTHVDSSLVLLVQIRSVFSQVFTLPQRSGARKERGWPGCWDSFLAMSFLRMVGAHTKSNIFLSPATFAS